MTFLGRVSNAIRAFVGETGIEAAQNPPSRSRVGQAFRVSPSQEWTSETLEEVRAKTRFMAANDGQFIELLNATGIYAVGDGFRPQPGTELAEWNDKAKKLFKTWTGSPDISGRFSWWTVQKMVNRALDIDGEIFILKTTRDGIPKIKLIPASLLSSESDPAQNLVHGIRFDAMGTPVEYRFKQGAIGQGSGAAPASVVIHVAALSDPTQIHGTPALQHVISDLIDLRDLSKIEKASAKALSDYGLAVFSDRVLENVQDSPLASALSPSAGNGGEESRAVSTAAVRDLERITGGKILNLPDGAKIQTVESNRPSPAWLGLADLLSRRLSAGTIPFEFVSDSSKIGGAGIRLVVAKAERIFSARQQELIEGFYSQIWKFVIGNAIAQGKLDAVENWTACEWATPRRITVDAGRDAAANRADVEGGLKSFDDNFEESGLDPDSEIEARIERLQKIKKRAAETGIEPELIAPILFANKSNQTN